MHPADLKFETFLSEYSDFSFLRDLLEDPDAAKHVPNKKPRQVFRGHYVRVDPTPLPDPLYVAHSADLLGTLGLTEFDPQNSVLFRDLFSGVPVRSAAIKAPAGSGTGWATGYALSIYGQEYYDNCPFRTGNGYGDGRAISVLEVDLSRASISGRKAVSEPRYPYVVGELFSSSHWEMQLKGGGTTPYCRSGDGRAVLRSSVREFLASEAMYYLGVPTSRALCLFVSATETVQRPWYGKGSLSEDPDRLVTEPTAITTRVAPSFIRVGQLELFGRRARKNEHPNAIRELRQLIHHTIKREYAELIPMGETVDTWTVEKLDPVTTLRFANLFALNLARLVAHWIRVGYCQGNFNSDNCAVGGWTLDYGPFGFVEEYAPEFQMWTGGGEHFSFMNQPTAAAMNFKMFCFALMPVMLLFEESTARDANGTTTYADQLGEILKDFPRIVQREMEEMIAKKMGLLTFRAPLWNDLESLLRRTSVDWTLFWRTLSDFPSCVDDLKPSFYSLARRKELQRLRLNAHYRIHFEGSKDAAPSEEQGLNEEWNRWISRWHEALTEDNRPASLVSAEMRRVNPRIIPREWMLVDAYTAAEGGNFSLLHELQQELRDPYGTRPGGKYYKKKPEELFGVGGVSHCSCSS
jgi:uncharacterized protein YdiU (UPF0061 family)